MKCDRCGEEVKLNYELGHPSEVVFCDECEKSYELWLKSHKVYQPSK
jgi:hypothetical protein